MHVRQPLYYSALIKNLIFVLAKFALQINLPKKDVPIGYLLQLL